MKLIFSVTILCLLSVRLFSQCSDAGVCSVGKHSLHQDDEGTGNIRLSFSFGRSGDKPDLTGELNDLTYSVISLEANQRLPGNTEISFSIPYVSVSGPLGDNRGIGDLILLFTSYFSINESRDISVFAGGKFATGKVNSDDFLPQRYQPGLGSNDLLIGAGYTFGNFNIGIAYQKPFGRSDNVITRIERGDDLLLRAGYNKIFGGISIKGELLAIFRIQESSILVSGPFQTFMDVPGSDETQVNLLLTGNYILTENLTSNVQLAVPFLERDFNYDGLKRAFTIGAGINFSF